MKRFVEGTDRSQSILFPVHLDDYVAEDNIVRVVDAFIEAEMSLHVLAYNLKRMMNILGIQGLKAALIGL